MVSIKETKLYNCYEIINIYIPNSLMEYQI